LEEGDTSRDFVYPSPGLIDASKAEVHLVVRTHGGPIHGHVHEQLTTFGGGCTPETGGDLEYGNECIDQQFAIHVP
jgi:hypothetical protein